MNEYHEYYILTDIVLAISATVTYFKKAATHTELNNSKTGIYRLIFLYLKLSSGLRYYKPITELYYIFIRHYVRCF